MANPNTNQRARRRWVAVARGGVALLAALAGMSVRAQFPGVETLQVSGATFPLTLLTQSSSQPVQITVTRDNVTIQSVQADAASAEYAVVDASNCTGAGLLAPGASCTVGVRFTPLTAGWSSAVVPLSHPGVLVVTYVDQTANATYTSYLPLSGTAGGPRGVFTPGVMGAVAGNDATPQAGYAGDGAAAAQAQFQKPQSIVIDGYGNIFIADTGNNAVRVIYKAGAVVTALIELEGSGAAPVPGNIYTVAGNGVRGVGTDQTLATLTSLNAPAGVAVDAAGNLYIADTGNNAVRVIYMGDLPQQPLGTVLGSFYGLPWPTPGFIYTIAGQLNGANQSGGVACTNWTNQATTGGTPGNCWNGDVSLANQAQLWGPTGIAVDDYGDLLIADTQNGAVRGVSMGATPSNGTPLVAFLQLEGYGAGNQGYLYTVAGNPTVQPVSGNGDGGYATAGAGNSSTATLTAPQGVAMDSAGDLYIADTGDNALRFVSIANNAHISTVATGSGIVSVAVDAADNADFVLPGTCAVQQYGLDSATTQTLAGNGTCGPVAGVTGDGGPATAAELNTPVSVAVDPGGNLYVLEATAVRFVDGTQSGIAFGSQQVITQSAAQTVTLMNLDLNMPAAAAQQYSGETFLMPGAAPSVTVASPFVSLPYAGAVPDCSSFGTSLFPGQSCDLSFAFAPQTDGPFSTTATFSDNSFNAGPAQLASVQSIALSGTGSGTAPTVSLTASLNFNQAAGAPAATQYLTLTNLSTAAAVSVTSVQVSAPFAQNGGTCGATLAANSSCTIGVSFATTTLGQQSGTVTVSDSASTGGGMQMATLTATGTVSSATVTLTPSLAFTQQVGKTAVAQYLTLTNQSATLPVEIYSFQSSYPFLTGSSGTCGTSLAPSSSCTIQVYYSPQTATAATGSVTVSDSSATGGGTQTASLSGQGTEPAITVTANMTSFGTTAADTTEGGVTVTITNTSSGATAAPLNFCPLTLCPSGAFAFTGTEPTAFQLVSTTCGPSVAPGGSCTVSLGFSPATSGGFSASFSVFDDAGDATVQNFSRGLYATQTLNVTGTATVPVGYSSLVAGNTQFPPTQVGQTTTQVVTLTLNTAVALKSIAIRSGFADFSVGAVTGCTVDGATVNMAGTICQISVTFAPVAAGNATSPASGRIGPLVVTTAENGGTPYVFGLLGTGQGPVAALTPGVISIAVEGGGGVCASAVGQDGLPANQAAVGFLDGMALDTAGNIYLSDQEYNVLWRIDSAGTMHLFAGNPFNCAGGYLQSLSGDGGPALNANISQGGPLAVDAAGGLYIGDSQYVGTGGLPRIRYIDPGTGIISSIVGNPGNGWPTKTRLFAGATIQETLTVSGSQKNFLFTVTQGGVTGGTAPTFPTTQGATVTDGSVVWTNSGLGTTSGVGCTAQTDMYGDGCTGFNAEINNVTGLAIDGSGDIFFSDWMPSGEIIVNGEEHPDTHAVVRRMDAKTGVVTIVAGNGTPGHTGDNGQALNAEIQPGDLALDGSGNLDITEANAVRQVNLTSGVITTIAGNSIAPAYYQDTCYGTSGDGGVATSAGFGGATGVAVDAANDLYVADDTGCDVRRVDQGTQTILTITGTYSGYGFNSGDLGSYEQGAGYGSALYASLKQPQIVRLDGQGNVYIMERANGVRKINVSQSVMDFNGQYGGNTQAIDTVSAPLTTTVLNAGNYGQLAFGSVFLNPPFGVDTVNFTRDITNPMGVSDCYDTFSVGTGYECPVNVDFTPTVSGPLTGHDIVTDNSQNATAATQTITMYATATGTPPQVTLTPPLLAFDTPQGGTSAPQTLTLTNYGTTAVSLTSIAITQGGTAFAETNNCGMVLAGSSSCQIYVTFSPPVVGAVYVAAAPPDILTGQVVVTDSATNSPQTAALTGTGTLPAQVNTPPLNLAVTETVHVTDSPAESVSLALNVSETVHVGDSGGSGLSESTVLNVSETIHVTDSGPASLMASTLLNVAEAIHVTDAVSVVPQQTTPTITWTMPAAIVYGTPLGGTQLDATSSVAGTFTYTPAAGAVLTAGSHSLGVSFAPGNTAAYLPAGGSTSILVTQEPLAVTAANATRVYGAANPVFSGTITGAVNGDALSESFSTAAVATSAPGSYAIAPTVSGTNLASYSVTSTNGALTITKANTVVGLVPSATSIPVGTTVTLTATVASTTSGTPTGTVTFLSGATVLGQGTLAGGTATLTTSALSGGMDSLTVTYSGDADFNLGASNAVVESVSDFTMLVSVSSLTGLPGSTITETITVTPLAGSFGTPITLGVSGLPPGATYTFVPPTVTPGSGPVTSTLTITLPALTVMDKQQAPRARGVPVWACALPLLGLLGLRRRHRSVRQRLLLALIALVAASGLAACSGGGFFLQSPTTYNVTVSGVSAADTHTTSFQLTVE
jgi:hypothetical protein